MICRWHLMSAVISTVITLLVGGGLDFMLVTFVGGLTGAFVVRGARTRSTLLRAGALVGAVQVAGEYAASSGFGSGHLYPNIKTALYKRLCRRDGCFSHPQDI